MKRLFLLTAALLAIAGCAASEPATGSRSADGHRKVPLADPFILLYDGIYYAYGTGAEEGIEVWTSRDLTRWEKAQGGASTGLALHRTDVWGERLFWAPEVYRLKNKFYMYFTAEEHICVATSDSPLGPFVQQEKKPMIPDERCIDNTLFIDDDGRAYMYFDRFNDGLNIWVAEMEDDYVTIKKETMHPCVHVSQEWEQVWPRVNEGCFVIEQNGTYFLTYSANSYESPFYGIGCATADSPLGPWTKYDRNPLLQNPGELVGVGHSAMFRDKRGRLKIVFHAHKSKEAIHPRAMYISDVRFRSRQGRHTMEISPEYTTPRAFETAGDN